MQTFVPYESHRLSAGALDMRRLGKQRVEGLQILNTLLGVSPGWVNHPAVKMWRGHERGLCAYVLAICDEWIGRGYKDTVAGKVSGLVVADEFDLPSWWGNPEVHGSHRSALVRKFPEHYGRLWPGVDPEVPYVWPV